MFINNINPIFAHIGPLEIRWYGLVYAISFIFLYFYLKFITKKKVIPNFEESEVETFLIGLIITMIIGARLFHCFIYHPHYYFKHPLEIFMIWKGGLSFHGAILFMTMWVYYFAKHRKIHILVLSDFLVFPAALFLALGRMANFVNGELVGKLTNVSWAVNFNNSKAYAGTFRHPTQIYEAFKNLFLFFILAAVKIIQGQIFRQYVPGLMTAIFLIGYGALRFFIEFLKEGATVVLGLNMGQILSVFVIIFGIYLANQIHKINKDLKCNHCSKTENNNLEKKKSNKKTKKNKKTENKTNIKNNNNKETKNHNNN